jgi:PhoH-like ATPase
MNKDMATKSLKKNTKIFVLDTSVILFDHQALYSFQDNNIVIPITVLEELDGFKKGNDNINFEARQFARIMDTMSAKKSLIDWTPIDKEGHGDIKVVFEEKPHDPSKDALKIFDGAKGDHKILNVATRMTEENPDMKVIFVTKDINLRIKAKALNIAAEDYETGKVSSEHLEFSGKTTLEDVSEKVIQALYETGFCEPEMLKLKEAPLANHYFILKSATASVLAFYNPFSLRLERVDKTSSARITPIKETSFTSGLRKA